LHGVARCEVLSSPIINILLVLSCLFVELEQTLRRMNPNLLLILLIAHRLLITGLGLVREITEVRITDALTALNLMLVELKLSKMWISLV